MTEITVTDHTTDSTTIVPSHIQERTENLLSVHPMTNQRLILDTAQWWFEHAGNCGIYRWCIHHLDSLENDASEDVSVYRDAREQAKDLGFDV